MNLNGSERQVYEYLDIVSLYTLHKAIDGTLGPEFQGVCQLPPFETCFGGLSQVSDPDVYDEGLNIVKEEHPWWVLSHDEVGDILEWALDRASFERLHMYGHNNSVILWHRLLARYTRLDHMTDEQIEADSFRSKLRQCESLHLDLLHVGEYREMVPDSLHVTTSVRCFVDLAKNGDLQNLKSLMVPFDRYVLLHTRHVASERSTLNEILLNLARGCPKLEEIGDLGQWPEEMVLDFVVVASRVHWPALKRLDVGPILFALQREQTWHEYPHPYIPDYHDKSAREPYRRWERSLRACMDQYDGSSIVDESLDVDPANELRDLAVIGALAATAFPSLEELTLTFESADEVATFFFVWTAFVFYKRVAKLEETGSSRRTPKAEFFSDNEFSELPVGPTIRRINIICSKLSDLDYEEEPSYLGVPDTFDMTDAWTNQFKWLRAKERRYPAVFPLQLFPNLQELHSNCGLPHRRFLEFLKGEPSPRLQRLEVFVGLHARQTMSFLLHNLAIDVGTFVIRPDMALSNGYLRHVMDRLDLSDERQCAIYRLLHKHCTTFSLPSGHTRAPNLCELFQGQCGLERPDGIERENVVNPTVYQRVYRPALLEDGGGTAHLAPIELVGSTRRELRSRRSRCQIDAAWLTAVKNNCFANSVELSVPEWLLAVLCCYVVQVDDDLNDETVFSYIPFDKNQSSDRQESAKVMDSVRLKTAQVFCHTPRLRCLQVSVGFDEEDELSDSRHAFLKLSIQALVEATCHLKSAADHNSAYQARDCDSDEPWLPDNVYHCKASDDDIIDEHGNGACPVAFGELSTLVIDVAPGNPRCYRTLHEDLLELDLDGVSGTTLASRLPLENTGDVGKGRRESVSEGFRGHYNEPEPGMVRSVLHVKLKHGPHQATTVFVWKDAA